MKHALVVGETGMLARASLWLLDQGYHVSIIARNPGRMGQLIEQTNFKNQVTPLVEDYKDNNGLQKKVHETITKNGAIDIVVAWNHSTALAALTILVNEISVTKDNCCIFHVFC